MTSSANPKKTRSIYFPVFAFMIAGIVSIGGRHFIFPGPRGSQLDLEWITALLLIAILPDIPALLGIAAGHWISACFLTTRFPDVSIEHLIQQLEMMYFIGIMVSAGMIIYLKRRKHLSLLVPIIVLIVPGLIIVGFTIANIHDIYVMIFGAGTIIISLLAVGKIKYMKHQFWILYFSWITGYSIYICLIWIFELDPNTQFLPREFFIKFCVIPFPVYLLQVVLATQIWTGIRQTDNSNQ